MAVYLIKKKIKEMGKHRVLDMLEVGTDAQE
jgi:hypothetical protein